MFYTSVKLGICFHLGCTGCGMKLRGDDPSAMKDFVLSIQNSVNQLKLKAHPAGQDNGQAEMHSKRVGCLFYGYLRNITCNQ